MTKNRNVAERLKNSRLQEVVTYERLEERGIERGRLEKSIEEIVGRYRL